MRITPQMLRDYLDDALPDAEMAAVEQALRTDPHLQQLLGEVIAHLDRGEHSVGSIWRRTRASCPDRGLLGSYLLNTGDPRLLDYIRFHLEVIGCPYCQANLDDLRQLASAS